MTNLPVDHRVRAIRDALRAPRVQSNSPYQCVYRDPESGRWYTRVPSSTGWRQSAPIYESPEAAFNTIRDQLQNQGVMLAVLPPLPSEDTTVDDAAKLRTAGDARVLGRELVDQLRQREWDRKYGNEDAERQRAEIERDEEKPEAARNATTTNSDHAVAERRKQKEIAAAVAKEFEKAELRRAEHHSENDELVIRVPKKKT